MFQTNPVLLKTLLENVETGKIQLPDFQRGWIWDDDRIRGLLASVSRGFPVGAIMTLEAGGDIKFRPRLIEGVAEKTGAFPDSFLLDGQQRLTSLYQALLHSGPVDTNDSKRQKSKRWYYINMLEAMNPDTDREDATISVPEDRKVTRDFGRQTVLDLSGPDLEYKQHMMPTERLMEPITWMLGYFQYWNAAAEQHPKGDVVKFFGDFQAEVLNKFTQYQLPVINLTKETPKEAVCIVFEKVNTGGVTLNVFELATALFAADAESFSLRDDWESRRKRMYSFSGVLRGIEGDQFLQTVALLKTQEDRRNAIREGKPAGQVPAIACKKKDILDLKLADYRRWADKVESGFMDAARFLKTQFIFRRSNVPYNTQLVPLAALYVELGKELDPAIARECLEQWYWSGIFGEVYGSASETQFALDLVEVASFVRGGATPRLINEAIFIPERLITLRTRLSAAYKGVYALQMKSGAADWITAEPLSIANYDNENIDIHHIFPVHWCRNATPEIPKRLYDSIINKTPIDASTNKIIGGRAPSQYLPRIRAKVPQGKQVELLESHWLDISHLGQDNFAASFVTRGEAILKLIGKAMGRDLGSGRSVFESAVKSVGYYDMYPEDDEDDEDPIGDIGAEDAAA